MSNELWKTTSRQINWWKYGRAIWNQISVVHLIKVVSHKYIPASIENSLTNSPHFCQYEAQTATVNRQEPYLPCHVCVHDLYKKYSFAWHYYSKEKCGTAHQTAMHTWGGTCFDILHRCTEHMHHLDSHKIHIPVNKNHNTSSPP